MIAHTIAESVHGNPRPKKTFTLFDPVTLPIELSAVLSPMAACFDAKRSGNDVPRATKVMAVMAGLRSIWQPIWLAKSEMSIT